MTDDFAAMLGLDPEPSALDRPLALTIFKNHQAKTGRSHSMTLRDVAAMIRKATVTEAVAYLPNEEVTPAVHHPLLKLASFKSNKRLTENIAQVTGVELDYDAGIETPEFAVERLQSAGLAGIVYTSRSYRNEEGSRKWRVLLPLKSPVVPEEREGWAKAAANVIGLPLDPASYTRAQIFYYASIEKRERHVIEVEGKCLDERLTPVETPKRVHGAGTPEEERASFERMMALGTLQSALRGIDVESVDDKDFYPLWRDVGMALEYASGGSDDAFALWEEFGARSQWYRREIAPHDGKIARKSREDRRVWDRFNGERKSEPVGLGTIMFHAQANGWAHRVETDVDDEFDEQDGEISTERVADSEPEPSKSREVGPPRRDKASDLKQMNRMHAALFHNGKILVLSERQTERGITVDIGDLKSLLEYYANVKVVQGDSEPKPLGDLWWAWSKRREYRGITFRPDGEASRGEYNMWRGWLIEPDEGAEPESRCPLILSHIHDVLCAGDPARSRWLIAYLAHMVQRPGEKPGTAVVIKGLKGAGKDTLGLYLKQILGQAFMSATNSQQVVGDFNAEIADKLLLNLEEGVFGGDHRADSLLKALVTSPEAGINQKFMPRFRVPSFHRLIITSNSFQPTKATADERRWFILEAADHRVGDRAYFNAIYREMNGVGPAAFLAYLKNLDISGVDIRSAPRTRVASEQIVETLDGVDAWWRDVVQSGELPHGCEHADIDGGNWDTNPQIVPTEKLRHAFKLWQHDGKWGGGERVSPIHFGRTIAKYGIKGLKGTRKEGRVSSYRIPTYSECLAKFYEVTGSSPEDDEWDPGEMI